MQEIFDDVLKDKRIGLVQADSGFYTEELLSCLEEDQHDYLMAAKMYPNVKSTVWVLDELVGISKDIELN